MKTNKKIETQLQRKKNSDLVRTIIAAKKNKGWKTVAEILSGPRKNRKSMNVEDLDKMEFKEKKVIVIGKVLSQGKITKKINVVAFSFSERAKEKLLKAGCEVLTMLEEIKKNPTAKGIQILKQ